MADRRPTHAVPSRSRATAPQTTSRPNNPLRSQLTRRPTATSASSGDTVRADADAFLSDSAEIVVRDQHGEVEMGDPPSPVVDEDDEDELAEVQQHESERDRLRLAEAVKSHRINHSSVPDQPEELLEAVKASLRAKVTALADDNWMFEPEDLTRSS